MNRRISIFIGILIISQLISCGAYFNQPTGPQEPRSGEITEQTKLLTSLPLPEKKIVVGVYNFKDQTGQYKSLENISSFSTAVTQGSTTILIKALEDSEWFKPIERENLGNLLNERNIIRSTRKEYLNEKGTPSAKLNPLLFAGILLEGGIISYDTNILSGGAGARYFGVGASTQYRQDRITIYLRAISTSTGEVLKTVNVSKTILSQAVDVGVFRYVNFQRLLEVETGFTKNEPTQLAVQAAIEKAVKILIIEGIQDDLWSTKEGEEKDKEIVDQYVLEKELEESTALYERKYLERDYKHIIKADLGMVLPDGDYNSSVLDLKAGLGYRYRLIPELRIGLDVEYFKLNSTSVVNHWWLSSNLLLDYQILPYDKLTPFLYTGPGVMFFADKDDPEELLSPFQSFFVVKFGGGVEYTINEKISLSLKGDWNISFSDDIDNIVQGRRNDYYYTFGIGVNYHFGSNKSNLKIKQ